MKKNKLFLFGILALMLTVIGMAFIGCPTDSAEEGATEEYRQVPDRQALNSNDSVLGAGYDITGQYAVSSSIRWPVLNFAKLDADGKIKERQLDPATYRIDAGTNINEYQESATSNISAGVDGSYMAATFSAEVGHAFGTSRSSSDAYGFATVRMVIPKKQYVIDGAIASLIPYLHEDFKADLLNLSPELLIQDYGTHVMLGGSWGGRVDYNSSFQKRTTVTKEEVSNYVKIKAGATFGVGAISANFNTEQKNAIESKFESTSESKNITIWGGSDTAGLQIVNANDYQNWVESLSNQANWIWYDFCPGNYLRPITDFITDAAKKAAVQTALNAYYAKKKVSYTEGQAPTHGSQKGSFFVNGFSQEGGGYKTGGGDSDINSKSGRTTYWDLTLNFTPQGQAVIMNYTYTVLEGAKNNTQLAITGSKRYDIQGLPAGTSVQTVNGGHAIYGSGSIGGKNHSWIGVQVSGLSDVQIKIDGTGDDQGNIAFKFNGSIPYTY